MSRRTKKPCPPSKSPSLSSSSSDLFAPRHAALLGLTDPEGLPGEELEYLDDLAAEQEFARWQKNQKRSGAKPEVADMRSKQVGVKDCFDSDEPIFPPPDKDLPQNLSHTNQELTEQQSNFIRAYIRAGGLTMTALVSTGTDRVTLKTWQQQPAFQAALAEAQEHWFEELRKAALLRAQARSDVLLIFMLKALCPEVYDDNVRKARWMAQNGLVDGDNLPVRAALVRDSQTLVLHETQNTQVNILVDAASSRQVDPKAEMAASQEWQDAFAVEQSPLPEVQQSEVATTADNKNSNGKP
jgi:hypothetical protein